jgi:hypothetical protein
MGRKDAPSTAWVNSGEKATWVRETSSRTRLNWADGSGSLERDAIPIRTTSTEDELLKCSRDQRQFGEVTDRLSHGDDLSGSELGDDSLENLVDDRRQDSLVVISAQLPVATRSRTGWEPYQQLVQCHWVHSEENTRTRETNMVAR